MMDQSFPWTKYDVPKLVEGWRVQFPIFQLTYDRPSTLRRARLAGRRPSARPPPGEGIHLGKNGEGEGEGGSEYLSGENREREPSGFSVIQLVNSCWTLSLLFPWVLSRNRWSLCESCSSTVASPDRIQRPVLSSFHHPLFNKLPVLGKREGGGR